MTTNNNFNPHTTASYTPFTQTRQGLWKPYSEKLSNHPEYNYIPSKFTEILINVWGWLSVIMLFVGIWYDEYRFKLITTSLLLMLFLVIFYLYSSDMARKKKTKYIMLEEKI